MQLRTTLLLFTTLNLFSLPAGATDAQSLLRQCIPDAMSLKIQSKVEVRVTRKNAPEEIHHFTRLEDGGRLFLSPQDGGKRGLLRTREKQQQWLYDLEQKSLLPLTDANEAPEWLLSESLLDKSLLQTFSLSLGHQSSMGGQSYYTVTATASGNDPYPKRSLSFKMNEKQQCDLIRAAYFDGNQKLRKKIYVQWQTLADTKMLKTLHIEDVQSLEAVRYHIEEVQVMNGFSEEAFPGAP